jgi:hypothetical protein
MTMLLSAEFWVQGHSMVNSHPLTIIALDILMVIGLFSAHVENT